MLTERHRRHVSRWSYPCPRGIHRGLADVYVNDDRFARTYERQAKGLAAYVRDAINANAEQAKVMG
jgi:hypothetical protein